MGDVGITSDGLVSLDYGPRGYPPQPWPVAVEQNAPQRTDRRRDISPLQTSGHSCDHTAAHDHNPITDWQSFQLQPPLPYSHEEPSSGPQFSQSYPVQASPVGFMSAGPHLESSFLDGPYLPLDMFNWQDFQADMMAFPPMDGLPDISYPTQRMPDSSSPTDTYLEEVLSLPSSSSDNGATSVENRHSFDSTIPEHGFVNPSLMHNRSFSESSFSDFDQQHPRNSFGSYVEIPYPMNSPSSESNLESEYNMVSTRGVSCELGSYDSSSPSTVSPIAIVRPIPPSAKKSSSPSRSPTSQVSSSPPSRKPSRKSPIAAKVTETKVRKQSQTGKPDSEKRVGKRKGPLKPDQRKQASEIRKLRACLRCKFLKKTVSLLMTQK